jgi:hypothetical protein
MENEKLFTMMLSIFQTMNEHETVNHMCDMLLNMKTNFEKSNKLPDNANINTHRKILNFTVTNNNYGDDCYTYVCLWINDGCFEGETITFNENGDTLLMHNFEKSDFELNKLDDCSVSHFNVIYIYFILPTIKKILEKSFK